MFPLLTSFVILTSARPLTGFCLPEGPLKCASDFTPSSQYVHISTRITVFGSMLTSLDMVAVARFHPSEPDSCGNLSQVILPVSGGSPKTLQNISSDGQVGSLVMTLQEVLPRSIICIKFYPEERWKRVGTSYFEIIKPVVYTVGGASYYSVNGNQATRITLEGAGLVYGIEKLGFKFAAGSCLSNESASKFLGGLIGLSAAFDEGSKGVLEFTIIQESDIHNLVLCMASNLKEFFPVTNVGFQFNPRYATNSIGVSAITPSISTEFFIVGRNFVNTIEAQAYIKIDSSCEGVSDSSSIFSGDGRLAVYLNTTHLVTTFSIPPIPDMITSIGVSSGGTGYQNGIFRMHGGNGKDFSGVFVVGSQGQVESGYVTSSGDEYSTDPIIEPAYSTASRCGSDILSDSCLMTGTVVSVTAGLGITTGCYAETAYAVGVGGGGYGFRAALVSNSFGRILGFDIENHGTGYTSAPHLVVNYTISEALGQCKCGSVIIDGQATQDSLMSGHVVGGLDACFTASVASGASFEVLDSGWRRRSNKKLCIKYGGSGAWLQIPNSNLSVLQYYTSPSFSPRNVVSYETFVLTIIGNGFEQDGPMQTKIKLANDCQNSSDSDLKNIITGGWGRPCDTIAQFQLNLQMCTIKFALASDKDVNANVCRRIGVGNYRSISDTALQISSFQLLSFSPRLVLSSSESLITVIGKNFGALALRDIKIQVCSRFICQGGGSDANVGEPCASLDDNITCVGRATCKFVNNSQINSSSGITSAWGCAMPGGEPKKATAVDGCTKAEFNCSYLVIPLTLLSMADITADLLWSFADRPFTLMGGMWLQVNASKLVNYSSIPATVQSLSSFQFSLIGTNIGNSDYSAAKFKYLNSSTVECTDGSNDDFMFAATGGSGRKMTGLLGPQSARIGTLTFQLLLPENFSVVINDWRINPKFANVRLCWKVGPFRYREIGTGAITTVSTTRIVGFTPSESLGGLSLGFSQKQLPVPVFSSNEYITLTVVGRNIGSGTESSLRIRPIAMPFDLNESFSKDCVTVDTVSDTRPTSCQEFPATIDDVFGGASKFCDSGSDIDSVLIEDELPIAIQHSDSLIPSSNPRMPGRNYYDEVEYAVYTFRRTLLRPRTRFMLCWSAISSGKYSTPDSSPWQPIGAFNQREGVVTIYYAFVVNTFSILGAVVTDFQPKVVSTNRPFRLLLQNNGLRCNNSEVKFKLTVGNALQSQVGGPIGTGCIGSNSSDTKGAVDGTVAVFGICQQVSSGATNSIFEISFPQVIVQYDTVLEFCWSMSYGRNVYYNAYISSARSSITTILASAPVVDSVYVNNVPIIESKLFVHEQASVLLFGDGLSISGAASAKIKISESCDSDSATIPGGRESIITCAFNSSYATIEFVLKTASKSAKLCMQTARADYVWTPYLDGFVCRPEVCGAPSCATGTNYLFDGFQCDRACCQDLCTADPFCKYYTWYEIPGRVYRRCQTSASCNYYSLPENSITIPHVLQRSRLLSNVWSQIGPNFTVSEPIINVVTPQARPSPVSGTAFTVNLQGYGMGNDHMQIHAKLVDSGTFGGGCNNVTQFSEVLSQFENLEMQRDSALKQIAEFQKLDLNGTCAGGRRNCEGGPAPPGTTCNFDLDCWGPSGPSGGGVCSSPNTGQSCLWNVDCTFSGTCNNSLAYLTQTPPPIVPVVRVPYEEQRYQSAIPGGDGRFVVPSTIDFASVVFSVGVPSEAVFCVALRDPEKEKLYLQDGYVVNSELIRIMYGYRALTTFRVSAPSVTEIFPNHIFSNAPTVFVFGGHGFSVGDRIKIVRSTLGCFSSGLSGFLADTYGAVAGGSGSAFDAINMLGTNASVSLTISESLQKAEGDTFLVCYRYSGSTLDGLYRQIGQITIRNAPPIILSYFPKIIHSFEPTILQFKGTGLGGGQQVKLVGQEYSCRGTNTDEARSDNYGLAQGTVPSFLRVNRSKDFSTLQDTSFADTVFVPQISALFEVKSFAQGVSNLSLCIKYSDKSSGGTLEGYHTIGIVTFKNPEIIKVMTKFIFSGVPSLVVLTGGGLQSSIRSYVKLVERYANCSEGTQLFVAGGFQTLSSVSLDASIRSTQFSIRAGIQTIALVCHAFEGIFRGVPAQWNAVGTLAIRTPRFVSSQIFSPILSDTSLYFQNRKSRDNIVLGEPFEISVDIMGPHSINHFIKIIPSDVQCRGQDAFSDSLVGGNGQPLDMNGKAQFWIGILLSPGLQLPILAKACVWIEGTAGYVEADHQVSWSVILPYITDAYPLMVILNATTTLTLEGRGIATSSFSSFLAICSGDGCNQDCREQQVHTLDGGAGLRAGALLDFKFPVVTTAYLNLCWKTQASERLKIAALDIIGAPVIISILPSRWIAGNSTVFFLSGSGLNSQMFVKFVDPALPCEGKADKYGCDPEYCVKNWSGNCGLFAYADESGLFAISVPYRIQSHGHMKVCVAYSAGLSYVDTGLTILVEGWVPVRMLTYFTNTPHPGFLDAQLKSDTQRVESRMTDEVPPCQRFWRSNFMFFSQLNGVDRDTAYVYDITSRSKCWTSCADVPSGYPKRGLCPPGIDRTLIAVVRNVPISFILSDGVNVDDVVFIATTSCGDDLTKPSLQMNDDYVPGGEPIVVDEKMRTDVTSLLCNKTSSSLNIDFTGENSRKYGYKVDFALTTVSRAGQYHRLCIRRKGYAASFSVPGVIIKITPPRLLSVEPSTVWAGRWINFKLKGEGLSYGDAVRIIDGETSLSCYHNASDANVFETSYVVLPEATTLFSSEIEMKFDIPSSHARLCYKFKGSLEWEEMTPLLSLRTSGYVYGYDATTHFLFGETVHFQNSSNVVGGSNQTISITPPYAVRVKEKSVFARALRFQLTIEGYGLTGKGKIAVMPFNVECGGTSASRINKIHGTGSVTTPLRTVIGGETRYPTVFVNDGLSGNEKLSQCAGSMQLDACTIGPDSQITVNYTSFDIFNIGRARICFSYEYASEFVEIGQLDVFRPFVKSILPSHDILLNKPFTLTIIGTSLNSKDLLKVVEGNSCFSKIASRPYYLALNVLDIPFNTTAVTLLTITGPGDRTLSVRKVCYSYDGGISFVDTGLVIQVRSPQIFAAFPTQLSMSAQRKITFYGDALSQGDQVLIIYANKSCEDSWDVSDIIFGGQARLLEINVYLPSNIGVEQWPLPAKNGSATFLLPRLDTGTFCYWHRDGAGWVQMRDGSGNPIVVSVINTYDSAIGISSATILHGANNIAWVWVLSAIVCALMNLNTVR